MPQVLVLCDALLLALLHCTNSHLEDLYRNYETYSSLLNAHSLAHLAAMGAHVVSGVTAAFVAFRFGHLGFCFLRLLCVFVPQQSIPLLVVGMDRACERAGHLVRLSCACVSMLCDVHAPMHVQIVGVGSFFCCCVRVMLASALVVVQCASCTCD